VRTYQDIDITQYTEAQLPLLNIKEPRDSAFEEHTSAHSTQQLDCLIRCYFVSWAEVPTATYEALTKAIRDKVAANFTLSGCASEMIVNEVSEIQGELPIYFFDFTLELRYYLSQQNT
jgi:hypothetical protein